MKYAKILILAIIIAVFIYYKFSKDNTILLEDKLSMFLLVKMHDDIDNILFDLSSQIKSFDEYIHNVYYMRDNDFLINKKSRLQFDLDYVNYKSLLTCSDISGTSNLNNSLTISGHLLLNDNCDPLFSRSSSCKTALSLSPIL